jgi:hypothetical protein
MSKLISKRKDKNGNTVSIYRHPIIAGMKFMYNKGQTDMHKMRQVGHYDYQITTSNVGSTISEKKLKQVFYDTTN